MRKQTKIAALVSATALLALGASITSFAAARGTWMLVDGEWYCYDSNGDPYEDTFCVSNGKDYYVGEDGMLVRSSWVDYDGDMYFVNSAGQKITSDWRLTTPYDDEDAEEEWYYFQASGKMATNKKIVYKGNTYFFDADGKMLTGWVTADGTDVVNEENSINTSYTYYADETGARVEGDWVLTVEPGVEEDDADADYYYYYLLSSGKVATGKRNNIKGQTYFFNEDGQMLSGWVKGVTTGTGSNADTEYYEIDGETNAEELVYADNVTYFYCGGSDDGHAKKDKWIKLWRPVDTYEEDEDNDKFWYWIEKNGEVFVPDSTGAATGDKYQLADASLDLKASDISVIKKKINSKDYFFNENGEMLSQFINVTDKGTGKDALAVGMYYFGGSDDGSMKTGSETVRDDNLDAYKFYFGTKDDKDTGESKGVGITGNKSNKLYYMGHLVAAQDYRYQPVVIEHNGENYLFIVNSNGSIQHSNVAYKEDGDTLIDARFLDGDKEKIKFETGDTWYKYAVSNDTRYILESGSRIDVDYLNAEDVMSIITPTNSNVASSSNN